MNGKLRTDIGLELDAEASLSQTGTRYHLTLESSGESGRRNGDYRQAFELALRRLASLGAVLHDGRVESRTTRNWDPGDKRLIVDYAPYPVRLSRVADIARLAKDLRTAGARVGRTADRGGNPTKRLTLDLSLPASFVGGLAAATRALFGTARPPAAAESVEPDAKLHAWWMSKPAERCWLEITGRKDLGTDLRAPLANEHGERFWSYSLLRYVQAGDIVFHYARRQGAIVAVSRASGTQWPDTVVWAARGTSARDAGIEPHARPGWYVGLENFKPLRDPVALEHIRAARDRVETTVTALKKDVGEPLYFPFELSDSRDLRPMQGYLFKLPQSFVDLFPALSVERLPPNEPAPRQRLVPGAYRRADEQSSVAASDPFSVDPAVKERALRGHATTQNALADFLISRGLTPCSAIGDQPDFDVAWEDGQTLWVAEVKSLTDNNEEKQLRLGLGQVLRYRQFAARTRTARAALVTEREPRDKTWAGLCAELGVALAWPGNWRAIAT